MHWEEHGNGVYARLGCIIWSGVLEENLAVAIEFRIISILERLDSNTCILFGSMILHRFKTFSQFTSICCKSPVCG